MLRFAAELPSVSSWIKMVSFTVSCNWRTLYGTLIDLFCEWIDAFDLWFSQFDAVLVRHVVMKSVLL